MKKDVLQTQQNLNKHAFGMIGVLIVQYLLGMMTNLFVKFPEGEHDGQLWIFAWRQLPLALHIIVGFLLLFGTLALLVRAIRMKNKSWIISSATATVAILGAITAGAIFIPSQTDWYSFIMAIAFIIALLAYFWGIYQSRNTLSPKL